MRDWPEALSNLKKPPLVETAISVQFAPVAGLTVAHIGWYWKNVLGPSWVTVKEAPALDDSFEKFGAFLQTKVLQLTAFEKPPIRLQINNSDGDRVVQIQNNRFVYNWRKGKAGYPSFETTYREFLERLEDFREFLRSEKLGEIQPNQWELTYVNLIPPGDLWQSSADFHRVVPGLFADPKPLAFMNLETMSGEQRFEIVPRRGRVYISGRTILGQDRIEVLSIQSTARGPIESGEPGSDLEKGLRLGHEAIGRVFLAVVSDAAIIQWEGE